MARSKQFLLEQIVRAQRFARAMNTDADRERFEKTAADLRRELDAVEAAEGRSSAVGEANPSQEQAVQTNSSAQPAPETADQEAAAPAASSGGDQGPTTD
ncbi:putative membrane protein [Bradyrhizobium sp. GM5.1]